MLVYVAPELVEEPVPSGTTGDDGHTQESPMSRMGWPRSSTPAIWMEPLDRVCRTGKQCCRPDGPGVPSNGYSQDRIGSDRVVQTSRPSGPGVPGDIDGTPWIGVRRPGQQCCRHARVRWPGCPGDGYSPSRIRS